MQSRPTRFIRSSDPQSEVLAFNLFPSDLPSTQRTTFELRVIDCHAIHHTKSTFHVLAPSTQAITFCLRTNPLANTGNGR